MTRLPWASHNVSTRVPEDGALGSAVGVRKPYQWKSPAKKQKWQDMLDARGITRPRALQDALFRRNQAGQPVDAAGNVQQPGWTRGPYNPATQQSPAWVPATTARSAPALDTSIGSRPLASMGMGQPRVLPPRFLSPEEVNQGEQLFSQPPHSFELQGIPQVSAPPAPSRLGSTYAPRGRGPIPTPTATQAYQQGQEQAGTLSGAMRAGNWNSASGMLHQQLAQGGRDILAQRAAGNASLRQQALGRFGNRATSPQGRVLGMPEQAPPQPASVPTGFVDRGERTAPVVVGGLGHRILRPTKDQREKDEGFVKARQMMDEYRANDTSPGAMALKERMNAQRAGRDNPLWMDAHTARKAEMAGRRAALFAQGKQDLADRKWRMSGAPQQQAQQQQFARYMMERNPALALGMMRTQSDAYQAELGRQQDTRQHLERMGAINAGNANATAEQTMQKQMLRNQRREQLHTEVGPEGDPEAIERQLDLEFGPMPGAPSGATPPAATSSLPLEFQGKTPEQIIAIGRSRWGNTPEADAKINELLKRRHPGASVEYPSGPSLWDLLKSGAFGPGNPQGAQRIHDWWINK